MLRVLKPGGHLLSFGGSRTYHRMASAVEDAGFEIRDQIMWVYGSGFPKSLDVSKAIDNVAGAEREVIGKTKGAGAKDPISFGNGHNREYDITAPATEAARQWQGWGTALKPAHEPLVLARKPLIGTVAANVLAHGTGGLNIDGCRVPGVLEGDPMRFAKTNGGEFVAKFDSTPVVRSEGRWPANLIHDGSDEVVSCFPDAAGRGDDLIDRSKATAARFFYAAKASKKDRDDGNAHPTVKPTDLMAYLCRLVTPAGGVVLDPFMGSGSTGKAAIREGFRFIGAEREAAYYAIAEARLKAAAV
jgi:site-specific DNA-methyltransferase (adenine-specific)